MIAARSRTPAIVLPASERQEAENGALNPSCRSSWRRAWQPVIGAVTAAATVAACSSLSGGGVTGSSAPAATAPPPASSDASFTSRVTSFFTGGSGRLASAATTTGAASSEIDCPSVEYRQGAATWAMAGPAGESSALSLRYQGSFLQTARECIVAGDNMTIKVGVQGRIVVGPAGSAGTVNIPLRYALVREGLQPQTLWTKLFLVPVTIPPGEPHLIWQHIEEGMTIPRPSTTDLEGYVVYIGFDPEGARPRPPPVAAKPKPARTR